MTSTVIWAHDARFLRASNGVMTDWQAGSRLWKRYLRSFDRLVVIGRDGALGGLTSSSAKLTSSCDGVKFELLPTLSSLRAQLFDRRAVTKRIEAVVANSDGVIVRLPSELGLLATTVAQRLHRPWAVEVVGCGWGALWSYGNWRGRAYAPVMFWRMRRAVAAAPFALYVTERFLQHRYPTHAQRVVACSNVEVATGDAAALAARQRRIADRWGKGRIVLGLIGTLKTRYKGIQTVFAALPALLRKFPGLEFHVLGAGDAEPWRREADGYGIGNAVYFDGVLPGGEPVLDWLDGVDLYCHPSMQEGLPRALIEAMSRGCPAVGTEIAGIPELLDREWLIRRGDARALAGLIERLLESSSLAKAQVERNWRRAEQYDRRLLEARRADFWGAFADYCREQRSSQSLR